MVVEAQPCVSGAALESKGSHRDKPMESGPPPLLHVPSQQLYESPLLYHHQQHQNQQRQHGDRRPLSASCAAGVSLGGFAPSLGVVGNCYGGSLQGNPVSDVHDRRDSVVPGPYAAGGRSRVQGARGDTAFARARHPSDAACRGCDAHCQTSRTLVMPSSSSPPYLSAPGHHLALPAKERVPPHFHRVDLNPSRRFSEDSLGSSLPPQEGHGYFQQHDRRGSVGHSPTWTSKVPFQKNGMMEGGGHQEGAINLSTVRDPSKDVEEQMNGEVTRNGENGHDTVPQRIPGKGTPVPVLSGAAKRKNKPQADPAAAVAAAIQQTQQQQQSLLMLAAQQGLTPQQMQNLQQQLIGGSQQSLLQQQQQTLMLQHQQQKLQEQALQQLHEQLQMNTIQQTQLLQQATAPSIVGSGDKGKGSSKAVQQQLQTLAVQQQQLVQQIQHLQLQQRHYLLACLVQPFGMPQGMMSPAEIQQLWKEVAAQSGLEDNALKNMNGLALPAPPTSTANGQAAHLHVPNFLPNGVFPLDGFSLPGSQAVLSLDQAVESGSNSNNSNTTTTTSNTKTVSVSGDCTTPLYRHCLCKWPGCDTPCEDYTAFLKHLNTEHQLDDRSTAQARVQLQVVSQLEIQLTREKELLQAMMQHLHMKPPGVSGSTAVSLATSSAGSLSVTSSSSIPTSVPLPVPPPLPSPIKTTPLLPKHTLIPPFTASPFIPNVTMVTSPIVPLPQPPSSQPSLLLAQAPPSVGLLPQHSTLAGIGIGNGCSGGSGGSSNSSSCGGGPIRRRVSDKCNLPISTEIQRNREFYKTTDVRPPFTYASLIRQAIVESPHRQLTLNEIYQWFQATFAYFRRNEATWKNAVRHNLSLHKCFMRVENVKGAVWTVDEVEFYKRRPQKLSGGIKSPSLSDPASYNETINATIRAALGDASLALMASGGQLLDQDTAQDLSIKSVTASSHDGLVAMARSIGDEELLMSIKREAGIDLDTHTFLDGPPPHQGSSFKQRFSWTTSPLITVPVHTRYQPFQE
ncbi:forkhead box protein P2-like isoform X2 [Pomacea canaliculata]|uniref:forkhead box protein P2-like isoform X2 n=1 Tax=Pomacea canaliculata TaxID=400727 RepID=UPI000D737D0E|nr:forkhead box protein P2-like isoform X2 [Pomacea canaliculata]